MAKTLEEILKSYHCFHSAQDCVECTATRVCKSQTTQALKKMDEHYISLLPEKESAVENESYENWNSKKNIYEYGIMIGKNQAIKEMHDNIKGGKI